MRSACAALAVTLSLLGTSALAAPAGPVKLSRVEADTLRAAIEKDRIETRDWLKSSPSSYLATTARVDFAGRTSLVVGSAADCDVKLDASEAMPHHLRVEVVGDSFYVSALSPGATFKVKDRELGEGHLPPSGIGLGRYALRLSHQRYPAVIVFDPKSPRYALYHGIPYFPVDFAYRFEVPLQANPKPETTIILSTRGNRRRAVRAGWFEVAVGGRSCRLEADRLLEPGVGENNISLFFRDATTGRDSYEVGRYIEPEPLANGRYLLDFNRCYNPACAYSDHYNCPIPPKENVLKVAIRAGERDPKYH